MHCTASLLRTLRNTNYENEWRSEGVYELRMPVRARKSDASGLLPVLGDDNRAAALESCAAAVRTAPLDSPGFVFLLPTTAFWKNYLGRIAFGQRSILPGMKAVSTDSQEIAT